MATRRSSIQRFEDLDVWRVGRELVKGVYRAARKQELRHDWELVSQMTRAAVSITSNIAEGHERGSRIQYVEFCFYAKGSAGELRSQVINAHDADLLDDKAFTWLHGKCLDVSRLLAGYIKHLIETAKVIPGMRFTREADRNSITWDEFLAQHGIQRLADGKCVRVPLKRRPSPHKMRLFRLGACRMGKNQVETSMANSSRVGIYTWLTPVVDHRKETSNRLQKGVKRLRICSCVPRFTLFHFLTFALSHFPTGAQRHGLVQVQR